VSRHLTNNVGRLNSDRLYLQEIVEQAEDLVIEVTADDTQHRTSSGGAKRWPTAINFSDIVIPEVSAYVLVSYKVVNYSNVHSASKY
jgi:hypothetical protein